MMEGFIVRKKKITVIISESVENIMYVRSWEAECIQRVEWTESKLFQTFCQTHFRFNQSYLVFVISQQRNWISDVTLRYIRSLKLTLLIHVVSSSRIYHSSFLPPNIQTSFLIVPNHDSFFEIPQNNIPIGISVPWSSQSRSGIWYDRNL